MTTNVVWGGAAISIVLASWGFYRIVVPKGAGEWARAGLVQAFIFAFYAEMYGFPVTIYLLVRSFNLDVAGNFWDSNLWVYLTGTQWAMRASMTVGYAVVVLGIMLMIAGWREVYRATKKGRIATGGPYASMRHPQYAGIFLALFGEGVVHWPMLFSLTAIPIIVAAYLLLARKEEHQMTERFGNKYREYQQRVPMFWPERYDWPTVLGLHRP